MDLLWQWGVGWGLGRGWETKRNRAAIGLHNKIGDRGGPHPKFWARTCSVTWGGPHPTFNLGEEQGFGYRAGFTLSRFYTTF